MKKEKKGINQKIKTKKVRNSDNNIFQKETKKKNYYSYEDRIFTFVVLILICFSLAGIFFGKSIELKTNKQVSYDEKSNIDYKVYLKDNDFYEKNYLEKDMVYVASLINSIDVKFNYLFKIAENSDIDFDYDIIGKLVITDSDNKDVFLEKEYTLLKNQKDYIKDENTYQIDKNIKIDYGFYNNLANKFKNNYNLDANSNLIVYLNIHKKGTNDNVLKLDDNSQMALTIPLSKKAINIKISYDEINKNSQVAMKNSYSISNYKYFFVASALVILSLIFIICILRFVSKSRVGKSEYDKYINKLLNEYDRLIVETSSAPITKEKNIIEIKEFKELLDVRDNLNLPIKYYIITKHQKCNFYISHKDELYLLTLKSVDMKKGKNKFFRIK